MSARRVRATLVAATLSTVVAFGFAAPASAAPAVPAVASSDRATGHLSGKDPLAKLTPAKILAKSVAAAKSAKTFRARATGKTEEGEAITIEATVTKTAGQVRVVTGKSGTYTAVRYGKDIFLVGDVAYWMENLADGDDKEPTAKALAGKWIQYTGNSAFLTELRKESSYAYWIGDLGTFQPSKRVKGKVVKGKATVGLADDAGADGYTFYVAASGVPYPMMVEANDKSDTTVFSDWNRPIKVSKPKPAIVLPISLG